MPLSGARERSEGGVEPNSVPRFCHNSIRGVTMQLIPDISNGERYRRQIDVLR